MSKGCVIYIAPASYERLRSELRSLASGEQLHWALGVEGTVGPHPIFILPAS